MSFQVMQSKLGFLFRFFIIAGLALLLLNLFMPTLGVFGIASAIFDSPTTSPPNSSPPEPSHSPPGQFKSPPGQFNSPPANHAGGNNNGYGPQRQLDLFYSPPAWLDAPDSSGKIDIYGTPPEPSKNADFPQGIDYQIKKLPCLDFVHSDYYSGRWFYTLYMITENDVRYRLQSFNPGCPDKTFVSWLLVPDIPEELLFDEDLVFEVWVEMDDGQDSFNWGYDPFLVLRGEDIIE